MEYLKDYDFELLYHSGKANVVVDTLSRKKNSYVCYDDERIGTDLEVVGYELFNIRCSMLRVTNEFLEEIRVEQEKDQ